MHISVTGGAGFVGSHIAAYFADHNHTVSIIDTFADHYSRKLKYSNAESLKDFGVTVHERDLLAPGLADILQGVEYVFHCAAQPGIDESVGYDTYLKNNEYATFQLLQALKGSDDLQALVNISSSSVYGSQAVGAEDAEVQPTSYYGVTKLAAEQLALSYQREHGMPVVSLRPFSVYGPAERPEKLFPTLITAINEDGSFPLYKGSKQHIRSFTYVWDVVDACRRVVDRTDVAVGEIFNIGTDTTHTTGEAISMVEEIMNKKVNIKEVPARAGDQQRTEADIKKAKEMLGWEPKTTLTEGLKETVGWFQHNYELYT